MRKENAEQLACEIMERLGDRSRIKVKVAKAKLYTHADLYYTHLFGDYVLEIDVYGVSIFSIHYPDQEDPKYWSTKVHALAGRYWTIVETDPIACIEETMGVVKMLYQQTNITWTSFVCNEKSLHAVDIEDDEEGEEND